MKDRQVIYTTYKLIYKINKNFILNSIHLVKDDLVEVTWCIEYYNPSSRSDKYAYLIKGENKFISNLEIDNYIFNQVVTKYSDVFELIYSEKKDNEDIR